MSRRIATAVLVSLALATAIHLDWHVARPATHHLSLGLSWHWLAAIPVFAFTAWYVAAAWSRERWHASLWIVGGAVLLGGLIEPMYEYFVDGAPFDWSFGPIRNKALVTFVLTGLITYAAILGHRTPPRRMNAPG